MKYLKLQRSDLEPRSNRDYRGFPLTTVEPCGGYPYHFPIGWYRHGLRVLDKYEGDQRWIGQVNGSEEWIVAYHGTQAGAASRIVDKGLLTSMMSSVPRRFNRRVWNSMVREFTSPRIAMEASIRVRHIVHCHFISGQESNILSGISMSSETEEIHLSHDSCQCRTCVAFR